MSKTIVVTGAGSGLGRALARKLASQGHRLILLGRTLSKVEAVAAELGEPAMAILCDIGQPDSVRAAFATIAEKHPRIDVLINNAGLYQPSFVVDATDAQIADAIGANFSGAIYCSRAAVPMMQRGGQILNVSSETVRMRHAMFSMYQSTKAGVERFSEALREELEPAGIRVTMVQAGQMMDEDSRSPGDPAILSRFAEENMKRGLNFRERPISAFASVVEVMAGLLTLPDDVHVPQILLEAWRP